MRRACGAASVTSPCPTSASAGSRSSTAGMTSFGKFKLKPADQPQIIHSSDPKKLRMKKRTTHSEARLPIATIYIQYVLIR